MDREGILKLFQAVAGVAVCLVLSLLGWVNYPVRAEAYVSANASSYEELVSYLKDEVINSIIIQDGDSFTWPETQGSILVEAGKTVTVSDGVWTIPSNITLEFGVQTESDIPILKCEDEQSSVRIKGTLKYYVYSSVADTNITLAKGGTIVCTNEGKKERLWQVNGDYTLSVEEGADLTLPVSLYGTLSGKGTVSGDITVNSPVSAGHSAVIMGSVVCTGKVTVNGILTIPKDSRITMSVLCVDEGTVKLKGILSLAAGGKEDHSIWSAGQIVMDDGMLILLDGAILMTKYATNIPIKGTGQVSLIGTYDTETEEWSGPTIIPYTMEQLMTDQSLLSNYVGAGVLVDAGDFCEHTFKMEIIKAATHEAEGEAYKTCTKCGLSYTAVIPKLTGGTDISSFTMTLDVPESGYTYDGTEKKPSVTVKNGNTTLPATAYDVVYKDNIQAGWATVTVTGKEKNGFYGTLEMKFLISAATLTEEMVILSADSVAYDGTEKKPEATVKIGEVSLIEGTDFAVIYKDNTQIGMATVIVIGISDNCTGTVTKSFEIKEKGSDDTDEPQQGWTQPTEPVKDNIGVTEPEGGNSQSGDTNSGNGATDTNTVEKGNVYTVNGYRYKVTGASTVAFAGFDGSAAKTVKIPKMVTIEGKSFQVTAIAANALKGTSVTKVIIGANVKKIKKAAFKNCKKLATIVIKSRKLGFVGKNAFLGIKPTAVIQVPAAKRAAYKKLLEGKGQGNGVQILSFV
jgi:hypothetical protein